uniref:DAGKc domain-containing protein n=1 Tax=Branchiostoma floridae TaxID=7739 RepID=C3Z6V4_BRAFL|eukprot:XP_002595538.1 hypothetical protein BRAFLDRAFT_259924 [Branchiostoma floridae]
MLGESDISFNMVVTERSGHAHDLMRDLEVSQWSGVVVVSGDGLIYEVINGLMDRPDWEEAIKMPIGLIPGGTGNALCCSVNYLLDEPFESADQVLHSTFVLCKSVVSGSSYPMDLVSVQTKSSHIFSFLHISWGFISDIDIGSEKYRYLGDARFFVGLVQRLFDLRKYPGHVSYLPVKGVDGRAHTMPNPDSEARRHGPVDALLPPLGQPLPDGWVTVEGDFNLVMALNVPHISTGFNMSPASQLDDGMMFLMYAMNTTRSEMSNISFKASQGRIGEVEQAGTDVIAVHAFRLEPQGDKGLITADGEVIEYGPLQAQVHRSLARVLMWKPVEI